MATLKIIGLVVSWAVLFAGIIGSYWKLKMKDQAIELKTKELEKEFIKELNDVDDKLERVFESQKKFLTKEKYKDMEEITSHKTREHVSKEMGKLKENIDKTMTNFVDKFGKMFEDMKQTIKDNGRA